MDQATLSPMGMDQTAHEAVAERSTCLDRDTRTAKAADDARLLRATPLSRQPRPAKPRAERLPALLQAVAALVWLPQAAALSIAAGAIADGAGASAALWPAAIVLLLGIFKAGLDAAGSRLAFSSARAVLSQKRQAAAQALARRSPLDIARPPSGLAASVLAEQADLIVPYLARFQPARLKATLVPIAIFVCVLPFSWVAAGILLFAAPLIPLFMALIGWRAKAASEKQLAETGGMNGFLLDRLRGMQTIRALDAVDLTANRLRADADSLKVRTMAVLRIAFLSSAVLELFAALGVAMTAVYVGFHLLGTLDFGAWGDRLSLSEGLFILLVAPAFFEPLRELSAVWHDRAAGQAALRALDDLAREGVRLPGAQNSAVPRTPAVVTPAAVALEGVRFSHAGSDRPVLSRFNLSIAAGEHIALLGPSGSGKSTLLALIAGLAPVAQGRIVIGGVPLTDDSAEALRARMAWIGQRPHLFAGSLAANIALGRSDIGPADIDAALRLAALAPVANAYGKAPIGETGIGLSGGEALRLALARAAANRKADLIIADEPTAHLDRDTAEVITDGLIALSAGKTLIIATHDPRVAGRMNRIVDLARHGRGGQS